MDHSTLGAVLLSDSEERGASEGWEGRRGEGAGFGTSLTFGLKVVVDLFGEVEGGAVIVGVEGSGAEGTGVADVDSMPEAVDYLCCSSCIGIVL